MKMNLKYGFNIDVILGTDFFIASRAVVAMENLELRFNTKEK